MSSNSRFDRPRCLVIRADQIAERDQDRIVVEQDGGTTSILYRGKNPRTRYLPPTMSVWGQIREAYRMG
jgi:hypothetical protein